MSLSNLVRAMGAALTMVMAAGAAVVPTAQAQPPAAIQQPSCVDTAPNAATARSLASRCGRRVEDVSATSEYSQLFVNPNGSSTLEASIQPRRVRRYGGWVAADPNLTSAAGGGWMPRASTVDMRFSGGGTAPLVTVRHAAASFTLAWPGTLPVPSIAGDTATYPQVLPGVDLLLTATVTGFSHVLAVRDAAAAANPAMRSIRYGLGGVGVRIDRTTGGGVSVTGNDGTLLLTSGAAVMWDSDTTVGLPDGGKPGALGSQDANTGSGPEVEPSTARGPGDRARRSTVPIQVSPSELVLTPDPALVQGARFPLYIDPAWHGPGASRWAYSNNTNENNDLSKVRMGRSPDSGAIYRPLFEFPVGALIGSRILSATFQIQLHHSWSCGTSPASLWRANGIAATPKNPWANSGVNTYLNTQSAAANKDSCYTPAQPTMFFGGNLTGDVQAVANAGWTAYTLALTAMNSDGTDESTTSRWKKFNVGTAVLVVNYNHPPRQPSLADLSIDPSIACTGHTVHVNTQGGLTLRATLSDPNNENLKAQWNVDGLPAQYAPPDSATAAAGSFTTTVPAAAFTDNTTYSWQVRGNDNTDAGAWSPTCTFHVDNSLPGNPTATSVDLNLSTGLIAPAPPATAALGRPAAVTITKPPADSNIAGYLIGVGSAVQAIPWIWVPAGADGNAVTAVVPLAHGITPNFLTIQARNLAGASGATVVYRFRANNAGTVLGVGKDLTGDGKADIPALYDTGGGRSSMLNLLSRQDGGGVFNPTTPIANDAGAFPVGTPQVSGDFNGDGRADVLRWRNEGGSCHVSVTWWLSTGNGYTQSPAPLWNSGPGNWCIDRVSAFAGDFTGDGKTDLAAMYRYDGGTARVFVWPARADGSGLNAPVEWWYSGPGNWDAARSTLAAGDFDGDGRDDFAALYDYGSCITRLFWFASNGSAFVGMGNPWLGNGTWCQADTRRMMAGDTDADGRDEVVAVNYTGPAGSWRVYRWSGTGLGTFAQVAQNSGWSDVAHTKFVGGDFNGDGRFDIGHFYILGSTWMSLWLLYSNGAGFGPETFVWDSSGIVGGMEWGRLQPL